MKFTIYGSGCNKCHTLITNTEEAAKALGINYEVEKISNTNSIIEAGIMRTPALAIDDDIVIEGKMASVDEIKKFIA